MLLTEFSTWYASCQEQCFGCVINLISNSRHISIPYLFNCMPFFSVTDVLLWSGIEKGPPRKEKFPEPQTLISALEAVL